MIDYVCVISRNINHWH